MNIRQATKKDIPILETLYKKRVLYNDAHGIHQWNLEDVTWENLSKTYSINDFYVLEDEDVKACCCIVDVDPVYWPEMPKGKSLYLHKIMVDPDCSKRGYGDALVSYFKEKGRIEGYPDVRLDVRAQKDKLRMFYERNGFELVKVKAIFKEYETALYIYKILQK